ncbi:MAG: hypothetical protein WBI20_09575 [Burkholderiaceae bacterium]
MRSTISEQKSLTQTLVEFIERIEFPYLSPEAIHLACRCMLDTFGLYITGSTEQSDRI